MSNTESGITIITPRTLAEAKELSGQLATAKTIPEALQRSPADVLAIVMAGAELGLAPMQSIRSLVLIKGKPTLSADAMVALVKARKDRCRSFELVESTNLKATYKTVEVDADPKGTTLSFTMEDAQKAGIAGDMYKKYPAQMLRARCKAALCREVYPDLVLGVYDPEELSPEQDVTPARSVIDVSPTEPKPDAIEKERGVMLALFETTGTVEELDALWPRLSVFKGTEHFDPMVAAFKSRKTALVAASRATKPNPTPPSPSTQTVEVTHFTKTEAASAPQPDDVPF